MRNTSIVLQVVRTAARSGTCKLPVRQKCLSEMMKSGSMGRGEPQIENVFANSHRSCCVHRIGM